MRVIYVSGLGAVWGSYKPDVLDRADRGTVGGGEAAMLETAFGLAARGHSVTVFYPGDAASHRGVSFQPLRDWPTALAQGGFDALVSWSDEQAIRVCPPSTRRVYAQQLNNMPADDAFWRAVDVIVPASVSHGRFLASVSPPGIDVAWQPLYGGVRISRYENAMPWEERANVVGYWSSPDRGLHHLFAIWPKIRHVVADAELRVAYHFERWMRSTRHLLNYGEIAWRARILETAYRTAKRAGGVRILGALSRPALAQYQSTTKVWAYPFDPFVWTEGLAVAMSEALAAGCYAVARPDDALFEVYDGLADWVPSERCDAEWEDRFADAVIKALRANRNPHQYAQLNWAKDFTWARASERLEMALRAAPQRRQSA